MPQKLGNGGYSQEQYDPNTGKYVADGKPNSSYDNPQEKKILNSMGLEELEKEIEQDMLKDFDKELSLMLGFTEEELNDDSPVLSEEELEEQEKRKKIVPRTETRKQIPPIWDFFSEGLKEMQIQEDIGCSLEEAKEISNIVWRFSGSESRQIGRGEDFESWLKLESYIKKAPKYEGTIYRGLKFYDNDGQQFLSQLQIGQKIKMNGVSSWTSNEKYSSRFSNEWDEGATSVILICENKKGVGIQHLSQYGEEEAEVIHSNYDHWIIKNIEEKYKENSKNKTIKVYLEEA